MVTPAVPDYRLNGLVKRREPGCAVVPRGSHFSGGAERFELSLVLFVVVGDVKDEFAPSYELSDEAFFAGEGGVGLENPVDDFVREEKATIDEWAEKTVPEGVVLIVDRVFIGAEVVKPEFDEGVEFFEGLRPSGGPIKVFCVSGVTWKKLFYDPNDILSYAVGRKPGGCGRDE